MSDIQSWSHSKIVEFEKCKKRVWLMQVAKIPEPERPLAPGKTEHANDRGSRIHDAAEQYVRGKLKEMPPELKFFRPEFEAMRSMFEQGRVSLEGEWAMNGAWEPTGWRGEWQEVPAAEAAALDYTEAKVKVLPEFGKTNTIYKVGKTCHVWVPPWLRLKLDSLVFFSDTEALSIDYKTGRKFGNEMKHAEQLQLYQLVTFLRYPVLELVHTELWYLDQDELTVGTFTRAQGLRFQRSWDMRGTKLTTCDDWPANPNIHSCKYCGYGPWGTGDCAVGVQNLQKRK